MRNSGRSLAELSTSDRHIEQHLAPPPEYTNRFLPPHITTMNTIRITLYIILAPIAIGLALGLTVVLLYYIGYGIFRLFNCSRKAPETPRFKTLVFWGLLACIPIVLLAAYLWK